jgi:hypothetical protein
MVVVAYGALGSQMGRCAAAGVLRIRHFVLPLVGLNLISGVSGMESTEPMVVYDFNPFNLPPDLLRAVGLITAAAAQNEHIVQQFVGALLGIDTLEMVAVTAHMSAPLKDDVARALIELNGGSAEIIDIVDDLLDDIEAAADKRNILVHNSFARHPETGEVLSFREKARGSLQVTLRPVSASEIEKDAAATYEVGMNLMRFMLAYGLKPVDRIRPVHAPLDRRKKARQARKDRRAT